MKPPSTARARAIDTFKAFVASESASGIVLLAVTAVALTWANSPWGPTYFRLWQTPLSVGTGRVSLTLSLGHWINDGLMAVFFFLVGLEIKREAVMGELASLRKAALPIAAAVGGMLIPALLYIALNHNTAGARGWGIPMATDIAFALGVLVLLGPGIPPAVRVFLAALAIADDIGAVLVIALFYTESVSLVPLAAAAALLALLIAANAVNVQRPTIYAALGLALWLAFVESGIHPTVAGVMLALTVPARARVGDQGRAPLLRMENSLHGIVAFGVVPLFALANAGVQLSGAISTALASRITGGILVGLLFGKPIGITLFSWLAVRMRLASLPSDMSLRTIHGVGWLGGIGFTMSLFIAELAFEGSPSLDAAKLGIIAASVLAGIAGWFLLKRSKTTAAQRSGERSLPPRPPALHID